MVIFGRTLSDTNSPTCKICCKMVKNLHQICYKSLPMLATQLKVWQTPSHSKPCKLDKLLHSESSLIAQIIMKKFKLHKSIYSSIKIRLGKVALNKVCLQFYKKFLRDYLLNREFTTIIFKSY